MRQISEAQRAAGESTDAQDQLATAATGLMQPKERFGRQPDSSTEEELTGQTKQLDFSYDEQR
jgi:hypothetical protein